MTNHTRRSPGRGFLIALIAMLCAVGAPMAGATAGPTPTVTPTAGPAPSSPGHDHSGGGHGDSVPDGFDPAAPFEVIEGTDVQRGHVDTIDGTPLSSAEIDAALARVGDDLGPGYAFAQNTNTFHWRDPNNPNDPSRPDIFIEADANVPPVVIDLMGEVMLEWRSVMDLDIAAPEWHHIRLSWGSNLPPNALGGALTGWVTVSQNGSTYVIPRFLANVNGAATSPGVEVMDLILNANIDWDYTLNPSDAQPNTKYYLKTVLLHEVGHALGVASGVDREQTINSSVLSTWGATFFSGRNLGLPFAALRSGAVRSNDLWSFNADGTWEKIYDPASWSNGSSLSHLDENAYTYQRGQIRTPGALMTPFLVNGEVNNVDGVIAGLLSQTGYRTFLSPAVPVVSGSSTNGVLTASITPGVGDAMNAPARFWFVEVRNPQGALVRTSTVRASQRTVDFGGFPTSGNYQVSVQARIDGQTSAAATTSVPFSPVPRTTIGDATTLFAVIYATDYTPADAETLRLYRAFFERDPDLVGIKYWLGQSRAGVDYDDMAWAFANSDEFRARYSNVTDRQFLEIVYRNVLDRNPDQAGFDYWYGEIQGGLARHLTVRWVAGSDEFSTRHPYLPQ